MPWFSCKKLNAGRTFVRNERGFTMPEILITVGIIGVVSSIGTVSYESARAKARDVKRVSDLKQIQTAVEFYFENHGSYPGDHEAGDEGLVLGLEDTKSLSDAGFAAETDGTVYMMNVPKNPEPGGSPYVYRSLQSGGENCTGDCGNYAMLFTLERGSGSYAAGPHAITPTGVAGAEGGTAGAGLTLASGQFKGVEGVQARLEQAAVTATTAVADFVQNPQVQAVAETTVAPTVAAAAVANTAIASTSYFGYLWLLFTQPFAFLLRRRRKAWGTVYNTLSRLGEDLVILRLKDVATGRIVRSTVTDREGRFSFVAPAGRYRVEASKPGYAFPSKLTRGMRDDGPFPYLYHGQEFEVGPDGAIVTPNIPLDPPAVDEGDVVIRRKIRGRRWRKSLAEWSLIFGALALAIKPSMFVLLLFVAQVVAFFLFRRLALIEESKRWGMVFDRDTKRPVAQAVARVFESRFNKLLDSHVTDDRGRYHFRVGSNVYYLTVHKEGYQRTETDPIDLSKNLQPTVIATDLPLARSSEAKAKASAPALVAIPQMAEATPPPHSPVIAPAEPEPEAPAPESLPVELRPDPSKWLNSL